MAVGVAETPEMERIRNTVTELHAVVDDLTREMRTRRACVPSDVVRRAEEVGAALARLEWALDRSADGEQASRSPDFHAPDGVL